MKTFLILLTFLSISLFTLHGEEKKSALREKRKIAKHLKEFGVNSAAELEKQAEQYCANGTYNLAINRYIALEKLFPEFKKPEEILMLIAGLQYMSDKPKDALVSIDQYGEKYPDSPKITQLVSLSYEIGKNYTLGKNKNYKGFSSSLYAIEAFEFVIKHDPYSPEASQSLLSIAIINMDNKLYKDAIIRLKEIQHKQPETEISAKADVYLGECYLRMNKGSTYSLDYLTEAQKYLEIYENQHTEGKDIKYAKKLLKETYLRMGIASVENIRYYCTAKKWKAALYYIDRVLKNPKLTAVYDDAKALEKYVKKHN